MAQSAQSIASELRSWRSRLDLTQAAAATALGVPCPTLRGWEGGRVPALPGMVRILMGFIERDAAGHQVAVSEPEPVEAVIQSPADLVVPTSHRVAPVFGRREVQPFFRSAGKARAS